MTPVPRDHYPGSPVAVAAGCTCTFITNFGGMGTVEEYEVQVPGTRRTKTMAQRYWEIDIACPTHGGGKFVPFVAEKGKR